MTTPTEFKRLNFFTGFFTTAADWTEGQQYHLAKQELQVEPVGGGDSLSVRVLPGTAIDGNGNDIYLGTPRILTIVPGETLPQLLYISVRYAERNTDYVENVEAPQ